MGFVVIVLFMVNGCGGKKEGSDSEGGDGDLESVFLSGGSGIIGGFGLGGGFVVSVVGSEVVIVFEIDL